MIIEAGYNRTHDLKGIFPISGRYTFRRSLALVSAFIALILVALVSAVKGLFGAATINALWSGVLLVAVALTLRCIYLELYRRSFYYGLDGYRLVISRGIVLKDKGSLPLLPVTEIYVKRGVIDMILGLSHLEVYTPIGATKQFARIECLTAESAELLQRELGDLLTQQIMLAPEAQLDRVKRYAYDAAYEVTGRRERMAEIQLDRLSLPHVPREKSLLVQ